MKKLLALCMASLLSVTLLGGCQSKTQPSVSAEPTPQVTETADEVVIGIAWRADTDSEFYTNITTAIEEAGGKYVLLEQVVTDWIPYADGRIVADCIDENDVLKSEYAEQVKTNGYQGSNAEAVMQDIDAVVFTGGEDICPTLYAEPVAWHGILDEKDYNATRDVNDYLLMEYCLDQDIPMMGFCRGMQMLAVVSGGTVIQDIPTYFADMGLEYDYTHRNQKATPDSYRDYAPHDVVVTDSSSLLAGMAGGDLVTACPSWHHQAVLSVDGTALAVTGTTDVLGVTMIEALERTDKTFAMGVQFHPEAAIVKNVNGAENADQYMSYDSAVDFFEVLLEAAA